MAVGTTTTWECNTGGSDGNAGGFNAARSGATKTATDNYTYGASATVISFTDLASANGTSSTPVVSSVARAFVAADVGHILRITSSTMGFAPGFYEIVSVSSGNATLDRACSNSDPSSGGVAKLGGAFASPGQFMSAMNSVGGQVGYIKAATYTVTTQSANTSNGCLSSSSGVKRVYGYQTTRGDRGTKPVIKADGVITSFTLVLSTVTGDYFENIEVDGNSRTSSKGFSVGFIAGTAYLCKASNCTNSGFTATTNGCICIKCEATGCSAVAAFNIVQTYGCVAHDNTITGFSVAAGGSCQFCLSCNNSGASSDGFAFASGNILIAHCSAYNNGRDGFRGTTGSQKQYVNCIAEGNAGYGFNATATDVAAFLWNCQHYNNASGGVNTTNITNTLNGVIAATGSAFTNAASGDFSLNTTAGAGSTARAGGLIGAFPLGLTTGYSDIGAVQHADPSSGGGTRSYVG